MEHAEVCPICHGSGKYEERKCHGCDGRGWVKVGTDYPYVPPYQPTYPDPTPNPWYRHGGYEVICNIE